MKNRFLSLLFIFVVFVTGGVTAHVSAFAGPFGIEWGMTEKDFGKGDIRKGDKPYKYRILSVPNPHNDFESYFALITPNHGLCRIVAVGKKIKTGSSGLNLKSAFNRIEDLLAGKYGLNAKLDFLHAGSIWNDENKYWMTSLKNQERTLRSFWFEDVNSTLPDEMGGVSLQAHAVSISEGFLTLSYESNYISKCKAEIEKAQSDPL